MGMLIMLLLLMACTKESSPPSSPSPAPIATDQVRIRAMQIGNQEYKARSEPMLQKP